MMYTITKGPSKLVTQRRTGPTQQLDSKINDFKHKQTSWNMPDLPAPRSKTSPGQLYEGKTRKLLSGVESVSESIKKSSMCCADSTPETRSASSGFVPLDLDEWWAQRFLANIDNLS
ncbi:MAPK regulated corepressor interacting protein 2-like [Xenentodon cancila]